MQQVRHYYNVLRWHDLSRLSQQEIANENQVITDKLNANPVSLPLASLNSFNAQLIKEPSSVELMNEALEDVESPDIAVSQSTSADATPLNALNDPLFNARPESITAL